MIAPFWSRAQSNSPVGSELSGNRTLYVGSQYAGRSKSLPPGSGAQGENFRCFRYAAALVS